MAEQKLLSSQGTEVNKKSTSYTSVVSPQEKRRKRKKRKIKKGSGTRLGDCMKYQIMISGKNKKIITQFIAC